jgi:putative colanic acid biosynthesis glycosyltransferase
LKILQVNTVCETGSTGRITTDLYRLLQAKGHECCIAYGRGTAPEGFHVIRIGTKLGVYLHALYSRITDNTAFASKRATKKLIKQIIEYQPDMIHLHNLHGYYINLPLLFDYFNKSGTPVIWSLYDCWSFTGHCCHFDYAGCERWKTGCNHCLQKKEYPKSLLFDHSEKNYERKRSIITDYPKLIIVPPTRWLYSVITESYLKELPCVIIPSGIDLSVFKPTESDVRSRYQLEHYRLVLGVSSGFNKYKGYEYFNLLADFIPYNYKIVLVGVEEEQKHLFSERILLLPKTNSTTELAQYYTAADVFVNPTLQETQGLTNIEALACGTGVVTFDSGGSPESIHPDCGLIVKRGDFKGLLEAVTWACEHKFDKNNCRIRAEFYDKEKLYQEYIKLYGIMTNL